MTIRARRGCSCSGCVDGGGGETTSAHLSVPLKFVVSHHCRQSSQPPPLPFNTKTSRDKKNHYERDRPTDGVESHHTSGVPTGISSIMLRGGGLSSAGQCPHFSTKLDHRSSSVKTRLTDQCTQVSVQDKPCIVYICSYICTLSVFVTSFLSVTHTHVHT